MTYSLCGDRLYWFETFRQQHSTEYSDHGRTQQTDGQAEIEELKAASANVDKFIDVANKYTDQKKLTPEVLRVFIAKVVIHERECKRSKASEQQIDIYFRYIGRLTAEPTE